MKHKNKIIFIAGLALFAVSLTLDKYILNFVSLIKNTSLDVIFSWVTSAISVFVILILITTLFLFQGRKREWVFPLWISFFSSAVIAFILKLIVARPRPSIEIIYPLINILDYSFPSMHTMVAFAVVPILDKEFFKIKWFWISFAVLVAFSRIYFGFHFLSDVVFGGFFGYFIGVFIIKIEEKYKIFRFLKMKLGVEVKRHIFHMFFGVLMVILLLLKIIGKIHIFFIIIIALIIALLKKKHEIPPIDLALKHFERPKNLKTFPGKGVIFYLIGIFLTLSFFPLDIAMPAIMILAFADPISHFFGTRFGKIEHPLTTKKFIEGMIAGIIAGFLGALIFVPWPQALAASFFAMIAEGIEMKIGPGRVDDNLIIPLVAAAVIWAMRSLM